MKQMSYKKWLHQLTDNITTTGAVNAQMASSSSDIQHLQSFNVLIEANSA